MRPLPTAISFSLWVLCLALLPGCPGEQLKPDGGTPDAGPSCRMLYGPGGDGKCEPLLPGADCPPGTMPVLGQRECLKVGWTSCPAGFEPDPSGWGCHEVLPPFACAGALYEVMGQTTCQPVGDCTAPFPPPDATHFVDPLGAVNATHFRSIGAALQAAPSGAVIAVGPGRYVENVSATRPVKLIGQCAEKVRLDAPTGGYTGLTIASKSVQVEGMSFLNHWYAIELKAGAEATVLRSVIEGNYDNGISVGEAGARLKLSDSVVRGTRPRQSAGGVGVLVVLGGFAELDRVALVGNTGASLFVGEAGSSAVVKRTAIRDTTVDKTGAFGYGINVNYGASLSVTGSAILGSHRSGVNVQRPGTVATLTETVVRGTRQDTRAFATGITVVMGGKLTLTRSLVTDTFGPGVVALSPGTVLDVQDSVLGFNRVDRDLDFGNGLYAFEEAQVTLTGAALVSNRGSAAQVVGAGTRVTLARSLLRGSLGIGQGLSSMGLGTGVIGAHLVMQDCAVVDNQHTAVFVMSGGKVELTRCALLNTRIEPFLDGLGHGIFLQLDSHLDATDTVVQGNAGIGALFSESSGTLRGSYIAGNQVGIHAQDQSELGEVESLPALVGPRQVLVSADTEFVGNQVRIGSGTLVLPPLPTFAPPK